MSVQIDITTQAGAWPETAIVENIVESAIQIAFTVLDFGETDTELSILLTDDQDIAVLNSNWRNKPNATNVLSFPAFEIVAGDAPGPMLGDIVLAHETIEREAQKSAISFNDHLTHLIVHGLLHLLGYDHENDTDAEQMELLEIKILAQMGIRDPYTSPVSDS